VAELVANRPEAAVWETFLCLEEADLAVLREMCGNRWARAAGVREWSRVQLRPGFLLIVGDLTIDLTHNRPSIESLRISHNGDVAIFVRGPAVDAAELALPPAPPDYQVLPLVSREAFLQAPDQALTVASPPDMVRPPVFAAEADQSFFFERYWHNGSPRLGEQTGGCEVRRARSKFILLQRFCEGILFDEHGTYSDAGYFHTLPQFPDGMRRDGDTIMLSRNVIDEAIELPGTFAVVFNPHLTNYYHWMVEAMVSLDIIHRDLPAGTKLLMPGTLAGFRASGACGFDHLRIMDLLGFGDIPVVEIDAPVCHVEEAVWLQNYSIDRIPGSALRAFRNRVFDRLGRGATRNRRIYIQRQGLRHIANAEEVERFCLGNGFTIYRLENVADDEQIRIFQEAEWVIAPHGAGLSNLLFCQTGTKIIEISPDVEFRPFFWQIADRLELSFGLLPCPTSDGSFNGNLVVDMDRLGSLFRTLEALSMQKMSVPSAMLTEPATSSVAPARPLPSWAVAPVAQPLDEPRPLPRWLSR
jgi:hypothetical protein